MALSDYIAILEKTIGLDAASLGESAVARGVRDRMIALGEASHENYLARLQTSPEEAQGLVERIVVPESWFFRHVASFELLVKLSWEKVGRLAPGGKVRILSAPCSTGEEPYSIAMALKQGGLDLDLFEIEALDISQNSLRAAREGVYGSNAFRHEAIPGTEANFDATGRHFSLRSDIIRRVKFRWGNLLDPETIVKNGKHDFIFCRNVLIYLTTEAQGILCSNLKTGLKEDGCLFSGPAETAILTQNEMVSLKVPFAFAFARSGPKAPVREEKHMARSQAPRARPMRAAAARPAFLEGRLVSAPATPAKAIETKKQPLDLAERLEQAHLLADQGQLKKAEELCQALLREKQTSAALFYILGLIREASGIQSEAGDFYKKAIYLQPDHTDALLNLALLQESQGHAGEGAKLRKRAQRVLASLPNTKNVPIK